MKHFILVCLLAVSGARAGSPIWEYDVRLTADGETLEIDASFPAAVNLRLNSEEGLAFVDRIQSGNPSRRVDAGKNGLTLPACGPSRCHVRYRFALARAAEKLNDQWYLTKRNGVIVASPSLYLLRPDSPADARVRLRVVCPPGLDFATGLFHSDRAQNGEYEFRAGDFTEISYGLFGRFRRINVESGGAHITVVLGKEHYAVPDGDIRDWVARAARAVTTYFARFPVPELLIDLRSSPGKGIEGGKSIGDRGAVTLVELGDSTPKNALVDDWVLSHEMVHFAVPLVARGRYWLEEGVATYVEPFARLQAGEITAERVWGDLVNNLPKSLPAPDSQGLRRTKSWDRIYWGGVLYCLLADIEIRERTKTGKGLQDALRGVLDAGGSLAVRWPIHRMLSVADLAATVPVLAPLYASMNDSSHLVDIDALWKKLGVAVDGEKVRFDDRAPQAKIRLSINTGITGNPVP